MLISLNWVKEFCPFETDETSLEIATRFSLHAAEVENAFERGVALGSVKAARVLEVRPHPDADRLQLVSVEVGAGSPVEVVCGAPNVRPGMVAPFAAPGTVIQGHTIREAKVRGVLSRGMLCSPEELEVSQDGSGLWELPDGTEPGAALDKVYPELIDVVLEVDNKSLTHRPDLWGHHGIAREFSTIYERALAALDTDETLARQAGKADIDVAIEKGVGGRDGLCRRYCGLQIDGVKVGPSPPWLQHRLLAIGSRPINNIVDVTNYILFELGQPLHAFDASEVNGQIVVRRAGGDSRLAVLDGSTVQLEPEDLVIADARSPVALAGIMGGGESEISEGTTSIFLESANFSPAGVRRTSVRVGKRTDSSLRFEKSLDPENARTGILRAAGLVLRLCPEAKVVGPLQDVGFEAPEVIEISTSAGFINRRLGTDLAGSKARGILERLGFPVEGDTEGEWTVQVPSWRATKDVSIAEDLVEEVGRIHGYDNIRPFAPQWPVEGGPVNHHRRVERDAKRFLTLHGGLFEVFTYSMVGAAHCRLFGMDPDAHLKIQRPLSEDMDRLRREILPLHIEKARDNQRYLQDFGFFEVGRVYRKENISSRELPDERTHITGVLSRERVDAENFFELRHLLKALLQRLRLPQVDILPFGGEVRPPSWAHPAICARVVVAGRDCGSLFRVHPQVAQTLELKGDVLAFDLDFDALFDCTPRAIDYEPPSRYPIVAFDVAVVAPSRTPVADLCRLVQDAAGDLFRSVDVFDIFENKQLGEAHKSVALHLRFGSRERTLATDEVTEVQDRVVAALREAGYPLR